jgi:tRNA threonylcarbamoyladenosine biosynthesis protein TsaE
MMLLQQEEVDDSRPHTMTISLKGMEETRHFARQLAALVRNADCLLLSGDLGAGKTTFARAFVQALAGEETEVTSPTYTLLQTYEGRAADGRALEIAHADLYRVRTQSELVELGLEELLASSVTLIEWPEIGAALWPEHALSLALRMGTQENERVVVGKMRGGWYSRLQQAGVII